MSIEVVLDMDTIEWPREPGNYKLGKAPHIAVAELGDFRIELPEKLYAVKGSLYTPNEGIVRVIKNIISNPNIKFLVLVGNDVPGFWPGQALIALKKNGVDNEFKIIGAKGYMPYLKGLSREEIEEFRRRVEIIDLRGREKDEVIKILQNLPIPSNVIPIKIIDVNKKFLEEAQIFDSDLPIGDIIEEETMARLWPAVLRHVWLFGKVVNNPRGRVKEVLLLTARILRPLKERFFIDYLLDADELEEYVQESFLNPKKQVASYTYGSRLFNYGKLEEVIDYLKNNPDTRRALATLWIPSEDVKSEDPPCLTLIQFFIRNNHLHLIAYWRSHDVYQAAPANWYGLSRLMEIIASKLHTKIGVLTTMSASAHIYERDWKNVQKIIGKYPLNIIAEKKPFSEDAKGYFLIKVDHKNKQIIVEHYNRNHNLLYRIVGKNAEEISHEIAKHTLGLRPEHYIYLGRELQKAEIALKKNTKYVQDKNLDLN